LAPVLIARLEVDGWGILLFEALDGHHAGYSPGSPDLPAVVMLLEGIAATPSPPIELRDADERLRSYVSDPADLRYFAGAALLHTDLNSANIIVDTGGAQIVDWGWATRGAAWLDPAYWALWLISAGHHPAAAEQWAGNLTTWCTASDAAFAEAQAALWTEISGRDPNDPWSSLLADASQRWLAYRRRLS
jgi:hypothetical protein